MPILAIIGRPSNEQTSHLNEGLPVAYARAAGHTGLYSFLSRPRMRTLMARIELGISVFWTIEKKWGFFIKNVPKDNLMVFQIIYMLAIRSCRPGVSAKTEYAGEVRNDE